MGSHQLAELGVLAYLWDRSEYRNVLCPMCPPLLDSLEEHQDIKFKLETGRAVGGETDADRDR